MLPKDALSSEGYELRPGESVSELLYRLNMSPMYDNGFLDEILKYNNLTRKSARRLKPGTIILLPERFSVTPVEKTPGQDIVEISSVQTPTKI